jgi:folylpolyglutamate synthase
LFASIAFTDSELPEFTSASVNPADLETLGTQTELANAWSQVTPAFPKENVHILPSIEHAVKLVRRLRGEYDKPVDALVTGSLLLVGGLIEVADLTRTALGV